jgi:hypothetical protein
MELRGMAFIDNVVASSKSDKMDSYICNKVEFIKVLDKI